MCGGRGGSQQNSLQQCGYALRGSCIMAPQQVGVVIDACPSDWTILQQDTSGHATLSVAGRVIALVGANANTGMRSSSEPLVSLPAASTDGAAVEVRVVAEATGADVVAWAAADTDGLRWSAELRLPAGGLYRLESYNRVGEYYTRSIVLVLLYQ